MAARASERTTLVLALVTLLILSVQLATCQAGGGPSDGDDQFDAYHGDIGRISGQSSSSAAAAGPQTSLVPRQPVAVAALAPAPPVVVTAPALGQHQHRQQQHQQASAPRRQQHHHQAASQAAARKPNRITLVPRREPIEQQAPPPPPPPLQPQPQQELAPGQQLVAAQLPPPSLEPSYGPLRPPTPVQLASGPALASFRSAGAGSAPGGGIGATTSTSTVSARHSALMAQVAAERAAAGALEAAAGPPPPPPQPSGSLGSPIEAYSAPAVAQVQPPPTLSEPSIYSTHQQQQQQAQYQPQASAPAPAPVSAPVSAAAFVDRLQEPLVAPSFEHVLSRGCPASGVFSYENKDHCDRYYICTNGTFTEEACPNGLAYSTQGAVYQHCAYNWNVDCGRKRSAQPIASPGCPWQFGIFPIQANGQCSIDYFVCEWGVPETKRCQPEGLFYDDRIKGCQWADQLGCKSEALLNFKCPAEDEDNPYWPYPRYYHNTQNVIVCVNEQPRLVHCNEDQQVDPSSLACIDLNNNNKSNRNKNKRIQ